MRTKSDFDFDDLVGEEFDFFYGASEPFFKLDDTTYEVQQDGEVVEAEGSLPDFGLPIARVIVEGDGFLAYELIDLHDEHCWLRIGTDYLGNFIFDYTPKDTTYHE